LMAPIFFEKSRRMLAMVEGWVCGFGEWMKGQRNWKVFVAVGLSPPWYPFTASFFSRTRPPPPRNRVGIGTHQSQHHDI